MAQPPSPLVPSAPAPAPVPARGPVPAQSQRPQSSGWVKGCLIAAAVVFAGCLGISALGYLAGMGDSQQQQEEDSRFNAPSTPPAGQLAARGAVPLPEPDREDDPEPQATLEPGCYVSEALVKSIADEQGQGERWEFVGLISRSDDDCPSGGPSAPSAQAQALARSWPFREEILQVEDSSPPREAEEPGVLLRAVRAHTQVADTAP